MATKSKTVNARNRSASGAKRKNTAAKAHKKNRLPVYIISMMIITLLLSVLMYIDYGEGGIINTAVKNACCGLFGICGYFVPVIALGLTAYLIKERNTRRFWQKLVLSFLLLINVSALVNLSTAATSYSVSDAFIYGYTQVKGGGFLGGCVSIFLADMVQKIASYIILFVTLTALASFISNVSIITVTFNFIKSLFEDAKVRYDNYFEEKDKYYGEEFPDTEDAAAGNTILEAANSFAEFPEGQAGGKKSAAKKKSGGKTKKNDREEPAAAENKEDIFADGIEDIFGKLPEEENTEADRVLDDMPVTRKAALREGDNAARSKEDSTAGAAEKTAAQKETDDQAPQKKRQRSEGADRTGKMSEREREEFNNELDKAIEQPKVEYITPPVELLNMPRSVSGDKREEMRTTAEKLITILRNFGVQAKLVQVTQGPTVTRYEIQPDTGIKLSKIVGLADDIALNLAVSNVLVAPVPGKAAVGVEIPNQKVSAVSIRELIASDLFQRAKSRLTVALGKDIGGNVVLGDIAKMPHVLIAGATGSGKSVCINSIIMSILYKAKPEEVKLIMVDPKVVELGVYNGIPHLLIPVVTEPKKAAGALNWAVAEMMRRYDLFKETGVRKLEGYNKLMENTGGEKIPQLVVIIDELADLMMVAAKEVEDYICRLAQLARAAGIHLIIATQRPSVDVITGLIKANIPSRIAFAVSSQIDSRTILDRGGAEKLLGMGDMLYHPSGARSSTRVQGAFVSDGEIEKVLEFIKENVGDTHYSEDLAEEIERCATGENGVTPDVEEDGDALLHEAIELAVSLGKISTSMVQRRLGVGYSRAGRIIDQMEARGVISGPNGAKPRDVLISHADVMQAAPEDDSDEE